MGNKLGCLPNKSSVESVHGSEKLKHRQTIANLKLEECLHQFKSLKDPAIINELIKKINEHQIKKKEIEKDDFWNSFTKSGFDFVNCLEYFIEMETLEKGIRHIAKKLYSEGEAVSIVGGLSMITWFLSQIDKMTEHQYECFELLRELFYLAQHFNSSSDTIPDEKFVSAIQLIVEGSIYCASRLESENSSFPIVPCDLDSLSRIRRKVHKLLSVPFFPTNTVGIEKPLNELVNLLKPTISTDESSLAVVIYGVGGVGKTTLAEAVLAKINLHLYNFSKVVLHQEEEKNDFKSLQRKILKDCFPTYHHDKPIELNDCKDGRNYLVEARDCEEGKPVFLFIDNAFRSLDLKELFPTYKAFLPEGSRILVTTRRLAVTNMFEKLPNVMRMSYHVQSLRDEDSLQILFTDPNRRGKIDNKYLERILKICRGVPLNLKIVSAHLHKERCVLLLEGLEREEEIKEEKLTERLVHFVYDELDESSQEAFLDICCFFNNWNRQDVEYILGVMEVTSLIRAALITSVATHEGSHFQEAAEELIVHDVVVAKGRILAKGNRITDVQSLCEAADEKRLNQIKGIWLANDKSNYVLQERHLNSMAKSLRVLALGDRMRFSKANQMEFEELRFLRIGGGIPELPVKLGALNNLRVFHGPFSIRGEFIIYKLPTSLLAMKVMEESVDSKSKIPEVQGVLQSYKLEKLHVTGSRELTRLLEGSDKLDALKTFILDDVTTMEELPNQICRLSALNILRITKSESLKSLPENLEELKTLSQLRLSYLLAMRALPSTFCKLRDLTHLDLEGCCTLQAVPLDFENLKALSHLSLRGCRSLQTLPPTFGYLPALEYLNLASCEELKALPPSFVYLKALKHLCLKGCTMLEILPPSFEYLKALKYLSLDNCIMLQALPVNFGQLTDLEYLNICHCEKLKYSPIVFGELRGLKCLECSPELKGTAKDKMREDVEIVAY